MMATNEADKASKGATYSDGQKPKPKKRRRKWRILTIVILVIAGVIWLLPYLVSTNTGSGMAISLLNDFTRQNIKISKLSLSWLGPCRIAEVNIHDPQGRKIFQLAQVNWSAGVLQALLSPMNFGHISLEEPRAVVYAAEEKKSPSRPKSPPAKPASKAAALPEPTGALTIKGGGIRIVQSDGRAYDISQIEGQFDLKTLNDIKGTIQLELNNGGKISGQVDVTELVSDGRIRPDKAQGTARLETDGAVDLAPLIEFLEQETAASGKANLSVQAQFSAGAMQTDISGKVIGLSVQRHGEKAVKPIDINLVSQVKLDSEKIACAADLTGGFGGIRSNFTYRQWQEPPQISGDKLIAAVLTGESVKLPDFSLEMEGQLEIPVLAAAVPAILKVRPGLQVTTGRVKIDKINVHGGASPQARGKLELADLSANNQGQIITVGPVQSDFDISLEPGAGLHVRRLNLSSPFAEVSASGTTAQLEGNFTANLSELNKQAAQLLELGSLEMAGHIKGAVKAARAEGDRLNVELDITGQALRYKAGQRQFNADNLDVHYAGYLKLVEGKIIKLGATRTTVNLDEQVVAQGAGWYDMQNGGMQGECQLQKADLAYIGRQSLLADEKELSRYTGTVKLDAKFDRSGRQEQLTSTGEAVISSPAVDGQPLSGRDIVLNWQEVKVNPQGSQVTAAVLKLDSDLAQLTGQQIKWQSAKDLTVDGKIDLKADLSRCLTAVARITKKEKLPAIAGKLEWSGISRSSQAGTIVVEGKGRIDQLEVGSGSTIVREPQVQLSHETEIDQGKQTIRLTETMIISELFSAQVTGTIEQYKTSGILALRGWYEGSWEKISALLHELVPTTAETISLAGTARSDFEIKGPIRQAQVRPSYRGMEAAVNVGWNQADIYGLEMGKAMLSPTLKEGQISIANGAIPTGEGKIHLDGISIDLRPDEPTVAIPAKLQLLEQVPVNPRMGRQLLSRINPVFADMAGVEGKVSLIMEQVSLPLSEQIKHKAAGQGHLDVSQLKVQPDGLLRELMRLGGMSGQQMEKIRMSSLDFFLKDGRINYDNLLITLGENFDLKFYGSVGFDDTLDLVVSVPIRPEVLEQFKVRGPVQEYAQLLAGTRVNIPLAGTRLQPKLDFNKVDIKPIIQKAAETMLKKQAGQVLEKILLPAPAEPNHPPEKQPREKEIIDIISDILKKQAENSKGNRPQK